ncbi:MAG: hypothetical protein M3020_03965 [Myxococcota bacterium]|jgi:hypothetical protein|nr:hypothetical protein [Myxococcota bacterium]
MPTVIDEPPRKERYLSDYPVRFCSEKYPLLAFLYAVYAGGENVIYCDHSEEYHEKYLEEPFTSKGLPVPDYIKQVYDHLENVFDPATEKRTKTVHADAADWDLFLAALKVEMTSKTQTPPLAW